MERSASRRAWVWVAIWLAFQLTLTTLPGSMLPTILPGIRVDLAVHVGLYAALGALVARGARLSGWPERRIVLAWVAIAVLGALDELHQRLVPGREAELIDALMDATGAAVGLAVGAKVMRKRWGQWLA